MATTFQTQDFPTIAAAMINHARATQSKITDFTVGSKSRTLLESVATQIDEFYQQVLNGLLAAIPVSTFQSFNFPPLPAVAAGGLVAVDVTASSSDLLIPQGTVLTPATSSNTYATIADVTIPAGSTTANLSVVCTQAGAAGNLAADQAFTLAPLPTGFVSASNSASFSSGHDAETVAQQTVRFAAYVNSLQRCNDTGIAYGLSLVNLTDAAGNITERVAFSFVDDPVPSPGAAVSPLTVYIHNGVGGTSDALVAAAQNAVNGFTNTYGVKVPGYKAAGVPCTVYASTDKTVVIGGTITAVVGYDEATLATAANAAIANYIAGLGPGASFLEAQAYKLVMNIPGVFDWVPGGFKVNGSTVSAGDIAAATTEKLIPGVMAIA